MVKIGNNVGNIEDTSFLSPSAYFLDIKGKTQLMTDHKIHILYQNALQLAEKYNRTGQKKALRKLKFHLESIVKEKLVLEVGINRFIYRDDIEEYIENVSDKQVVISDLKSYERDIPDDIVEKLEKVQDIFDEFYVVYTDYTGKVSKQVNKERREKDPILFGAFVDREKQTLNERFYFIGDWIDEYCDLTLEKMIGEMKTETGKNIENTIYPIPNTKEELQQQLSSLHLEEDENGTIKLTRLDSDGTTNKKYNIFTRMKKVFSKNDK